MADNANAPAKPSLARRVMQAVAYTIAGVGPETWMSPLQPLRPMAEQSKGRAFDYPVAFNLNYIPRASEALSFAKLKTLAETGIIRTLIQTRQDQMSSLEHIIRVKQDEPGPKGKGAAKLAAKNKYADKIAEISEFLESPDRRLGWHQWLHQFLEQHFVYDAVCTYKRRTKGGQPYAWEIIDASTISLKIDADGRPHPPPPSPAYQQVLKGLPASNYTASIDEGPQFTTGEMLYIAQNSRVDRAYGFPVVAQILTHVEMMLSRSREQLAEFNSGNSPHGVIEAPVGMTTDQITSFQDMWDSLLSGNIEMRRRMFWVANGSKYTNIPREMLFDQFDEWLVRVACFAFSIAPTPFIKQMNRATAESSQEVAASEGLQPLLRFVQRYINRLIETEFNVPQLEFAWVEDAEFDPSKKAVIDVAYASKGILTIDEVRDTIGQEGFGGACAEPMYATATGWVPVDPVEAQALKPVPATMGGGAAGGKPGAKKPAFGKPNPNKANTKKPPPGAKAGGSTPAKTTTKSLAASLYIHRPLLNGHELVTWAKAQGFASPLAFDDLHCTQCYSRDHIEWGSVPQASSHMVYAEGGKRSVQPLGDDGAIVLKFDNDDLQGRHLDLKSAGVSHDYDGYQPNVTITYKGAFEGTVSETTKDADGKDQTVSRPRTLADVEPYEGVLLFGEEVWRTVKDDWQAILKMSSDEVDAAAFDAHPNPSQAQIDAGNYRHGHVEIQGLDISIENPRGSTRSGLDDEGNPWSATLPTHYGYIKRTEGADGEHVDVYLGPNPDSTTVWVLDQVHHATGEWDEHKVFLGYDRFADAQRDYLDAFSDGLGQLRVGGVTALSMDEFKAWLENGNTTRPITRKRVTINQRTAPGTGYTFYDVGETEQIGGDDSEDHPPENAIDPHRLTPDNHDTLLTDPPPIRPVLDPLLPKGVGKSAKAPFSQDDGRVIKYSDSQARDSHGRWTSGGESGGNEAQALLAGSGRIPSIGEFYASLSPAQSAAIASARERLTTGVASNAPVSQGGFVRPDGTYTPEREAVHQQILNNIFTDKAVVTAMPKEGETPTYTMLGGRGGSGKSNLTQGSGPMAGHEAIKLDNDAIKAQLPGYQGWNAALYHEEASHVFERADALAREAGLNVVHDATMRTASTAEKYIAAYSQAGYNVQGFYMFAPPGVAAQRAVDRFTSHPNGRFVPPEYVLNSTTNEASFDRVKSSMSNWAIYTSVAGPGGSFGIKLVAKK